jgi:hypothetical protein
MENVKVFCFVMFCARRTGDITIFGKGKGAHIVMEDYISQDSVTLSFKKMACPEDITGFIVKANKFTLSGAFGGYLVLDRRVCGCTSTKSKKTTSMTFAVIMSLMQSINIPFNGGEGLCKEG